jgi:hypothetical protein
MPPEEPTMGDLVRMFATVAAFAVWALLSVYGLLSIVGAAPRP